MLVYICIFIVFYGDIKHEVIIFVKFRATELGVKQKSR